MQLLRSPARSPSTAHRRRVVPIVLFALAGIFALPSVAHAANKIAVIDLRRAVADTEDGLRVQSKLQQLSDSRQGDYEAKEKAYTDAKAEFQKLSTSKKVSEKKLRKRYAALEKMAIDLQNTQLSYRRELQRQQNELTYPIIKHMLAVVRRLAEKGGYDMVLNKEAVPYFRSDLDITDRIIQMYNFSQGSQGTPPAGKKPAAKRQTTSRHHQAGSGATVAKPTLHR